MITAPFDNSTFVAIRLGLENGCAKGVGEERKKKNEIGNVFLSPTQKKKENNAVNRWNFFVFLYPG